MKYVFAMIAGGTMVTVSFISGVMCMYGIMNGPYPKNHGCDQTEEATESEG